MNANINLFIREIDTNGKRSMAACRPKLKEGVVTEPNAIPDFVRMEDIHVRVRSANFYAIPREDGADKDAGYVYRDLRGFNDMDYSGYVSIGGKSTGGDATIYFLGQDKVPVVEMALDLAESIYDALLTVEEREHYIDKLVAYHGERSAAAQEYFSAKAAAERSGEKDGA